MTNNIGYIAGQPHYFGCALGGKHENPDATCDCQITEKDRLEGLINYKESDLRVLNNEIKMLKSKLEGIK
jgi:hypothetical protein